MTVVETKKRSVCIVGAGAAGLATLRNFLVHKEQFGEIVSYEQTKVVGGTWNYVEKTGVDENGLPIHSSMYKNLRTNLPKQIMEYPDFELKSDDCFMPHAEFLKYLQDYSSNFQLVDKIQFESVVRNIRRNDSGNEETGNWTVTVENFRQKTILEKEFDIVVLCHGHYSTPLYTDCANIDVFKGKLIHSHDYRTPEQFKDQTILVIGAGSSGTDIGLELTETCDNVYILDRSVKPTYSELGRLKILNGSLLEFGENSVKIQMNKTEEGVKTLEGIDTVLVCTGYRMNFDILDPSCGISVNDDNTINGFYKHVVNIAHPSMACVGINSLYPQCKLFYMQSLFYIQHLIRKFELPSAEEMNRRNDEEMEAKLALGLRPKDRHRFKLELGEKYLRDLETEAGMENVIKPVTLAIYCDVVKNMEEIPLSFKQVVYNVINDNEFVKL